MGYKTRKQSKCKSCADLWSTSFSQTAISVPLALSQGAETPAGEVSRSNTADYCIRKETWDNTFSLDTQMTVRSTLKDYWFWWKWWAPCRRCSASCRDPSGPKPALKHFLVLSRVVSMMAKCPAILRNILWYKQWDRSQVPNTLSYL